MPYKDPEKKAEWQRKHRQEHREERRKYRQEHKEQIRESNRKYNSNREKRRMYYKANSNKVKARNKAQRCISLEGQCCAVCFSTEDLHRAHFDYAEPLEVTILCRIHHSLIDRIYGVWD